jgi:SprT protein
MPEAERVMPMPDRQTTSTKFSELNALFQQAETLTAELLNQAAHHFDIRVPAVEIRFDLRGTAAGQVRLHRNRTLEIRYNLQLLADNREEFIARTVPHEVAHVIAYCAFGRRIKPHGKEWKSVMGLFNADTRRCHSYPVSTVRRRQITRYRYVCGCRTHQLSAIRHNRISRGQTSYSCIHCNQTLQPAVKQANRSD